jgi:putative ABC transport system permease protein
VVLVFSGSVTSGGVRAGWGNAGTLKIEDAEAILREIPDAVAVSPEVRTNAQVGAENQNWFTNIQGESPDYFSIRNWQFAEGTSFSDQDVRGATKVAVIGQTIVRQLFGNDDPLGQILRVKGVPFEIVGVLAAKGFSVMGQDQDDVVIMPYTSA